MIAANLVQYFVIDRRERHVRCLKSLTGFGIKPEGAVEAASIHLEGVMLPLPSSRRL